MQKLWAEEKKFRTWFSVELAVLQSQVELGEIPREVVIAIEAHAKVSPERIAELEAIYRHDMIAFIGAIQESLEQAGVGMYKEYFHRGITSYDIEDPALILLLRQAVTLIMQELKGLHAALIAKAKEHQWTLMIARTHGQDAEPTTFGHLLLVFAKSVERSIRRLKYVRKEELQEAKISGAVGNYAGMNPLLEKHALTHLGLTPANAETQILQRDRHAFLVDVLGIAASSIEQMARTFWEMMRSGVHELEEPRTPGQRGSSAMAHKKNPIATEQLMGLARMVRSYALVSMENIATPECRDISQSSAERHIFPGATSLVHYMAHSAKNIVEGLVVFPERMRENLEQQSLGVWASQRVRNALMDASVPYDTAYTYLQEAAFEAQERKIPLRKALAVRFLSKNDRRTAELIIGKKPLEACFDAHSYIFEGIEHLFRGIS